MQYLRTKRARMGHLLGTLEDEDGLWDEEAVGEEEAEAGQAAEDGAGDVEK